MKKIVLLSLIAILCISCTSSANNTNVSFENEVLFKVGDKEVTKGSIYKMMTYDQNMPYLIVSLAQTNLINELVPTTDDLKAKAQAEVDKAKKEMGENFAKFLQENRRQSEQEFFDNLLENAKQEKYLTDTITNDKEKLLNEFKPVKLSYLVYDKEEDAKKALELMKKGTSNAEISKQVPLSSKSTSLLAESVVNTKDVPSVLVEKELSNGIKDKVYHDTKNNLFYVVNWLESDYKKLEKEFVEFAISNQEIATKVMAEAMKANKFEVYEQAIYDGIKNHQQLNVFSPVN